MDFFDLLFGPIGPSLQFIFKIGYIPNENDFIQHYCDNSKQIFKTTEEKLQYMASALPEVFSKDTPYEKYHHMSIH